MKKYLKVLQKCPLFYQVEEEDLQVLLPCLGAKIITCEKKETIFVDGDPANHIGIMLDGSAQVNRLDYHGNRSIISEIEPPEIFAEAFACAEVDSMPVTIVANQKCEIMLIESERVMRTCAKACGFHRQMIFNLMKNLAEKNVMIHQKMEIISQRSTKEKLLTYLEYEARKTGSGSFDIPFDRQELADYLQVDRSGLSVEISKLKKGGIIRNNRNHFELLRWDIS